MINFCTMDPSSEYELRNSLQQVKSAHNERNTTNQDVINNQIVWRDIAVNIMSLLDDLIENPAKITAWIGKDYVVNTCSPLEAIIILLSLLDNPNEPLADATEMSFYQLAYAKFCTFCTQLVGDRFCHVQKLLIKYIFEGPDICSLFASDCYMFIIRIVSPNHRDALIQILMNLCKQAPKEQVYRAAAMINRVQHPTINFDNSKYEYII